MRSATPITDHEEIRRWVAPHNGRPACDGGAGEGEDPGMPRIDVDAKDGTLKGIS